MDNGPRARGGRGGGGRGRGDDVPRSHSYHNTGRGGMMGHGGGDSRFMDGRGGRGGGGGGGGHGGPGVVGLGSDHRDRVGRSWRRSGSIWT
eukprot:scaffold60393_cov47-Attheya_sp.AAC.1